MSFKDPFGFIPVFYQVAHAPLGQFIDIYLDTLPQGSWRNQDGTIYVNRLGMGDLLLKIVLAEACIDLTRKLAVGGINYPYQEYKELVAALDKYARLLTNQFMKKHWPND
jgi:hypothetical protein